MSLISALLPNFSADVVAVFDQSFNQLFDGARPLKASINESAKVMEHPVETGVVITDHKIINPIDIELSMLLTPATYTDVYGQIKQTFLAGSLLTVQTRTASYPNMLIAEMPHEEDPGMFDVIALALKLHEVQFVQAQYGTLPPSKVKKKSNASTADKGQVQTSEPNTSILKQGADAVTGYFGGGQ